MKQFIVTVCFFTIIIFCYSQDNQSFSNYKNFFKPKKTIKSYHYLTDKIQNEVQLIVLGAFILYKKTISSQDSQTCVFHPSCSVYAIESIRKKGLFYGALNSFDRLTRCHGFTKKKYPLHKKTHRLYDPVQESN